MHLYDLLDYHFQYSLHTLQPILKYMVVGCLIVGLLTRFGALAIIGTITVAIYHAIVTSGFNIYLLELLILYFGGAFCVLCYGGGEFAIDRFLRKFRIKFNRPHLPFE